MKQFTVKAARACALFSAAAGILLGFMRIFVSVSGLDPVIEMYPLHSGSAMFFHVLTAVCMILLALITLPARKKAPVVDCRTPSRASMYLSLLTAFMLAAYDLILVLHLVEDDFSALGPLVGRTPVSITGQPTVTLASAVFLALLILAAIPAMIYYFKCAYADRGTSSAFAGFSTAPVVWFILYALHTYFDSAVAFNSPVKILRLVAILAFLLYTIQEARFAVGAPIPYLYYCTGSIAVLMGMLISVSDAFLYAKGIIRLPEGFLAPALAFSCALYTLCRIFSAKTPAEADADAPAAEPRQDETH